MANAYDDLKHSPLFNKSIQKYHLSKPEKILEKGVEIETEVQWREKVLRQYDIKKSSASFSLNDVESFVYGPFTSRFWIMRKYINMLDPNKLQQEEHVPFHAWDCITLSIRGHWDIYLVIKNEHVMTMFLKLLLYKMRTVDGTKGSANKLI